MKDMQEKQKENKKSLENSWHSLAAKEVLARLQSRSGGLTADEVSAHRRLYGENSLPRQGALPFWRILLAQIASPLVFVLFAAAAISWFIGDILEAYVVLAAVLINTVVGFWQEYKADRALQKLTALLRHFVTVERDGRQQQIDSELLVVGDVVILQAGDKISADARMLDTHGLQVNEASLTGESVAVEKHVEPVPQEVTVGDRSSMVFAGTIVTRGTARAVVVAVGEQTQIGRIAGLVAETKQDQTPLQRQLISLSRFLTMLVVGASLLLFCVGTLYGFDRGELLVTVAALAVAAIPEGLLVSLTVVLVIGMQRLLRKRGLVRKMLAAETLGSVTVVCADKTGTLTKGVMQVARIVVHGEHHDHGHGTQEHAYEDQHLHVLKASMLCNNAFIRNPQDDLRDWEVVGDQTEAALMLAGVQTGFDRERLAKEYLRLDEIPFDERYKFMATLHHVSKTEHVVFVKGAPEVVLDMCANALALGHHQAMTPKLTEQLREEYRQLARQGLRVLAVASRAVSPKNESFNGLGVTHDSPELHKLTFDGWVGLKDPVRPEVRQVFANMWQAGMRPLIITGDHPDTVRAVAAELGWDVADDEIMTGQQLDDLSSKDLIPFVSKVQVFARVEPKHKVRIVEALKLSGEVVAMFGDGVNDAPALKAADIAVVVNSGTDIAKDTADLILLDNHFGVITTAVREGRVMFDNIRRIFLFLVADSFVEVLIITAAMMLGMPLPLTALQILWKNIIADIFPTLALTVEGAQEGVMVRPPRPRGERIVNREVKSLIVIITAIASLAGFAAYAFVWRATGDLTLARTVCFAVIGVNSLLYVFSIRNLSAPIWRNHPFSNHALLAAVTVSLGLLVLVIYARPLQAAFSTTGLSPSHWLIVFGFSLAQIIVIEIVKAARWQRFTPRLTSA